MSDQTLRSTKFVAPDYDEEQMRVLIDDAIAGNIPAKLNLILHNQAIINNKLETLLVAEVAKLSGKINEQDKTA